MATERESVRHHDLLSLALFSPDWPSLEKSQSRGNLFPSSFFLGWDLWNELL
jgi:hypothetical protein